MVCSKLVIQKPISEGNRDQIAILPAVAVRRILNEGIVTGSFNEEAIPGVAVSYVRSEKITYGIIETKATPGGGCPIVIRYISIENILFDLSSSKPFRPFSLAVFCWKKMFPWESSRSKPSVSFWLA